jgi:heme/copper-type cytochrome/quinol oxidase subunit 2
MEDLILLFLVATLLVFTVMSTREHMRTKKPKKEPPPMSREKSLEIVTAALQKRGPKGTLAVFDDQIQKMEDLAAHDDDKDE